MITPLSRKQKAQLAQLATQAFNHLHNLGLIDAPGDTKAKQLANWRHAEQAQACGRSSLTKCNQDDYLPLRAHFNSILGRDDRAFTDHIKHQPANDHTNPDDTPEHRQQVLHSILESMEGTKLKKPYLIAIAKNQFKQTNLENLTLHQLQCLRSTINNRLKKLTT